MSDDDKHPRDERGRFTSGGGSDLGKWADKRAPLLAGALLAKAQREGGFSYRTGGKPSERVPKSGFMVSVPTSEGLNHVVKIEDMAKNAKDLASLNNEIKGRVEGWLKKTLPAIQQKHDHYLGGWMERHNDGTNKALHLDVSQRFTDKDKAVNAGKERNQLAIWHLDKRVNGSA